MNPYAPCFVVVVVVSFLRVCVFLEIFKMKFGSTYRGCLTSVATFWLLHQTNIQAVVLMEQFDARHLNVLIGTLNSTEAADACRQI